MFRVGGAAIPDLSLWECSDYKTKLSLEKRSTELLCPPPRQRSLKSVIEQKYVRITFPNIVFLSTPSLLQAIIATFS